LYGALQLVQQRTYWWGWPTTKRLLGGLAIDRERTWRAAHARRGYRKCCPSTERLLIELATP